MNVCHSKYSPEISLTQQELRDISQEISDIYAPHEDQHLPELVLLPVDPYNLFVYWNLKKNLSIAELDPNQDFVLRIYSLSERDAEHHSLSFKFDMAIENLQGQKNIKLPVPGRAYFALIGYCLGDDQFDVLVISNAVNIPAESPSKNAQWSDNEQFRPIENYLDTLEADTFSKAMNNFVQPARFKHPHYFKVIKNYNDLGYDLYLFEVVETKQYGAREWQDQDNRTGLQIEDHVLARLFSGKGQLDQ